MQLGKLQFTRPAPDAIHARALKAPATRALRGALARSQDPAIAQATNRALSAGARTATATRAREGLYAELQDRLGRLQATAESARTRISGGVMSMDALDALRDLADQLGDVTAILDGAAGPQGAFRDDALLVDLREAVGAIAANRPEALTDAGAQLFANGAQALQDKRDQAPLERRLAEQAVHVQAELSRLKTQQTTLLHHQAAIEQRQEANRQQAGALERARDRFAADSPEQDPPKQEAAKAAPGASPVLSAGMTP
jgi:hypothetical protein